MYIVHVTFKKMGVMEGRKLNIAWIFYIFRLILTEFGLRNAHKIY